MSRPARCLAVLSLLVGFTACSKRPISEEDAGAGGGGGGGGMPGGNGGAAAGTGGTGGSASTGNGATGGSAIGGRGGASAGTGGGATAGTGGTGGSVSAGNGGATGGGTTAGTGGGATAGTGGGATAGTGGSDLGPLRLVIFYTRWGTSYPDWFPTGNDRDYVLSAMLQPLQPHKSELVVVSGLTNANVYTDSTGTALRAANSNDPGDAMISLLTARPATMARPALGPSLDTAVGDCGGAAGLPLRLAVGKFGFDDNPGVSFAQDGTPMRGERDPRAVAMRVLGHTVTSPDPDVDIDTNYPAIGAAHMMVAVEALATRKACVVTLMWGDAAVTRWLPTAADIHSLSHLAPNLFSAVSIPNPPLNPGSPFVALQTFYAQQFAALLARLRAIPLGAGTLLDRSVVVWISESGTGSDHQGLFIPVVIAGRGGGRLDVGRFVELKTRPVPASDLQVVGRTQGDLLAALAGLWGLPSFGDPQITRQPLAEILKP